MDGKCIKYLVGLVLLGLIIFLSVNTGSLGPGAVDSDEDGARRDGGSVEEMDYLPEAYLVLNTRDASEVEPPFTIKEGMIGASGGKCFYIGPEKVNEKPETQQYKRGYLGAANPGYVKYRFKAPHTALYSVWVRVRWSDDCGDSLDICFGDNFFATIQGNSSKYDPKWIWLKAGSFDFPVTKKLEQGKEYTLMICNREDDLYFDQILLIDADAEFEPADILDF